MKGFKTLFAALLLLVCFSVFASADSIIGLSTPGGLGANDYYNWSQLGPDGTTVGSSFGVVSTRNNSASISLTGSGSAVAVQCPAANCSWTGNFNAGDSLLWTSDSNGGANGPLSMSFTDGIWGAGAYVQEDIPGQFTVRISAYNGNSLLGAYDITSDLDGNVVFVGLVDTTGSNINRIVFDITGCSGFDCSFKDFAIDTVNVNAVPEPASVMLMGSGLAALGLFRKRR